MVNTDGIVERIVDRLQKYTKEILTDGFKNFDPKVYIESDTIDNTTIYTLKVNIATLVNEGDVYYDLEEERFPVREDKLENYLKGRIQLKSLLLSKLINKSYLPTTEKYIRIKSGQIYNCKDYALDEKTGDRWYILSEVSTGVESGFILVSTQSLNSEFEVIMDQNE